MYTKNIERPNRPKNNSIKRSEECGNKNPRSVPVDIRIEDIFISP